MKIRFGYEKQRYGKIKNSQAKRHFFYNCLRGHNHSQNVRYFTFWPEFSAQSCIIA